MVHPFAGRTNILDRSCVDFTGRIVNLLLLGTVTVHIVSGNFEGDIQATVIFATLARNAQGQHQIVSNGLCGSGLCSAWAGYGVYDCAPAHIYGCLALQSELLPGTDPIMKLACGEQSGKGSERSMEMLDGLLKLNLKIAEYHCAGRLFEQEAQQDAKQCFGEGSNAGTRGKSDSRLPR